MPRDDDDNGDSNTPGIAAFNKLHSREGSSAVFVAGAARGGLAGGLAGAVLMPIAEGVGHTIAKITGLEKSGED
jgi:hypothetical protein